MGKPTPARISGAGLHVEPAAPRSTTGETGRTQTGDCLVCPVDPQQKPVAFRIAGHSGDSGEIQPRADGAGRLRSPAFAGDRDAHFGAAQNYLR